MITLTAVIRSKTGFEAIIRDALVAAGQYASAFETGTISYFVSEASEGGVFITHERYVDQAALDAHNGGDGAKAFFAAAEAHLAGVDIIVGPELFASA